LQELAEATRKWAPEKKMKKEKRNKQLWLYEDFFTKAFHAYPHRSLQVRDVRPSYTKIHKEMKHIQAG